MGLGRPSGHGGFSGGFSSGRSTGSYGGSHTTHSGGGLLSGIIIGSLLSRRGGGSGSSEENGQGSNPMYKRVRNQKATIITSAIMLAITITFVILSVVFRFGAVYGEVQGHCISYRYATYDECYFHTYTYTIDGVDYTKESQQGWEDHLVDGELDKMLYYKKSNPNVIYEKDVDDYGARPSSNLLYIFLAVFFGFVTIIIYAVGIYKYELDPEYANEQKRQEEAKHMEGKRKCGYCGTIMDDKENKCPNCGASNK